MGIIRNASQCGNQSKALMENSHSTDPRPNPARRSMFPRDGDDWASIAARELRRTPAEEANLPQSWNLQAFVPAADGGGFSWPRQSDSAQRHHLRRAAPGGTAVSAATRVGAAS